MRGLRWKPLVTAGAVAYEVRGAGRLAGDLRSALRIGGDSLLYRGLRAAPVPSRGSERTVRLRDGVEITYRLDRGDYWALRETWMDEAYELPFPSDDHEVLVDLGANIGLTSLWLTRRYGFSTVIAVEPAADNLILLRRNLERNGVRAGVVAAAVGASDGRAGFETGADSTNGRVSEVGARVALVSMDTVFESLAADAFVDVVKMDIEGSEHAVLSGDLSWLNRVRALVVEFHPWAGSYERLVSTLTEHGFRYLPAGSVNPRSMDAFVRT